MDVDEIDYQSNITFSNSEFKNNYAMKYGGIIYSKAKSTNLYVNFDNCTFENNDATSGISIYYTNKLIDFLYVISKINLKKKKF